MQKSMILCEREEYKTLVEILISHRVHKWTELTEELHKTVKVTEITETKGLWEEQKYLNKQNNVMTCIMMNYLLHNRKSVLRSLNMYKNILGGCSRKQKSGMWGERKIAKR